MSFTQPRDDLKRFTAYEHSKPQCGELTPANPEVVASEREVRGELELRLAAIGVEGASALIVQRLGSERRPARLNLLNANEGEGSPYLMPSRIFDEAGETIWNYDDGGDDSFVDGLSDYTVLLDRNLDAVRTNPHSRREDPTYSIALLPVAEHRTFSEIDAESSSVIEAIEASSARLAAIGASDEDPEDIEE